MLENHALIVFIYGLNFSFKMLFEEYLGDKSPKFVTRGPIFYM